MMTVKEIVAFRIRRGREESGLQQVDLARRIGKSQQELYRWETGRTQPRDEILREIGNAVGRPLYWFYMSPEEEASSPRVDIASGSSPDDVSDVMGKLLEREAREPGFVSKVMDLEQMVRRSPATWRRLVQCL